jgi:tellurite resistance protein TehA-like permease
MVVYMVLLSMSGALCWATLAHALPSRTTLEIGYLCVSVGMLVWLGVLPLLWFWLFFRTGLLRPALPASEILVIPLDVTFVRLVLRGPLILLASVLLSIAAFVWDRICPDEGTNRTVEQRV